ncbi:MAG: AMIN domain-containing protein [Candidatus Aminicenantes bacterium]|nr:AMIN domain-containing protein [Candidatus Aminicenantes bacterium]
MKISPLRVSVIFFSIALFVVPSFSGTSQEPPAEPDTAAEEAVSVLKDISYKQIGGADRLVVTIKVEGPFQIETFVLSAPKRLVIDFSSVSRIEAQPISQVNETGLLSIRSGQFMPTVARVAFDLEDPAPSYSISSLSDGVRVAFWRDAETRPEERPIAAPEKTLPAGTAVSGAGFKDMFLRVGPGMTLYLKPEFSVTTDRPLYGRTASVTETFRQGISPVFELGAGKRINPKFKAGLGVGYQMLWVEPALEGSLPHPSLPGTFREVAFEAEDLAPNMWVLSMEGAVPRAAEHLRSGMWTVYAWALYSLYQSDKADLSAGPVVGFSFGKLYSLEDFEVEEKAPYGAKDVTIASITFLENSFAKIDPGLLISGTLSLGEKLSAFAALRVHYVDVMVEALERRASLFRASISLGLELGL